MENNGVVNSGLRIPADIWHDLKVVAARNRRSINSEMVRAVEVYVKSHLSASSSESESQQHDLSSTISN